MCTALMLICYKGISSPSRSHIGMAWTIVKLGLSRPFRPYDSIGSVRAARPVNPVLISVSGLSTLGLEVL